VSHPAFFSAPYKEPIKPRSAIKPTPAARLMAFAFWGITAETTGGNDLHPSINDMLTLWRLTAATSNRKVTEDVTNENGGKERHGSNWRRVRFSGRKTARAAVGYSIRDVAAQQINYQFCTVACFDDCVRRKKATTDVTFPNDLRLKVSFSFEVQTFVFTVFIRGMRCLCAFQMFF